MPFKSKAQRRWMYANEPAMAKRWEKETPKGKKLPNYVSAEYSHPFSFDPDSSKCLICGQSKSAHKIK